MNNKYAFITNITDSNVLAWIRANLWILNYCNNEQELINRYRLINDIKEQSIINWIKNNPWILSYCINKEEIINEYNKSLNEESPISSSKSTAYGKKMINGHFHAANEPIPHNDFDRKAAFVNWYGIILTLIFSFVIGYLIAWLLLKVH